MKINALPMPYGNCYVILWKGTSGGNHLLLLDGGTSELYKNSLGSSLKKINMDIDLWVISHSDDDHIGGVLEYTKDRTAPKCNQWIYNKVVKDKDGHIKGIMQYLRESIKQNNKFADYLRSKSLNPIDTQTKNGYVYKLDGLSIRVATPLDTFFVVDESDMALFESQEKTKENDYSRKIEDLINNRFTEDVNQYNAASISLIIEHNRKRFFWTADSNPSLLIEGLEKLGYTKDNPLKCEYMSLPHHGSKHNINEELLSHIRCNKFVVTADGDNIHNLPSKEALARVLKHPKRNPSDMITFIFPKTTPKLMTMFTEYGKDIKSKYNFSIVRSCKISDY